MFLSGTVKISNDLKKLYDSFSNILEKVSFEEDFLLYIPFVRKDKNFLETVRNSLLEEVSYKKSCLISIEKRSDKINVAFFDPQETHIIDDFLPTLTRILIERGVQKNNISVTFLQPRRLATTNMESTYAVLENMSISLEERNVERDHYAYSGGWRQEIVPTMDRDHLWLKAYRPLCGPYKRSLDYERKENDEPYGLFGE